MDDYFTELDMTEGPAYQNFSEQEWEDAYLENISGDHELMTDGGQEEVKANKKGYTGAVAAGIMGGAGAAYGLLEGNNDLIIVGGLLLAHAGNKGAVIRDYNNLVDRLEEKGDM